MTVELAHFQVELSDKAVEAIALRVAQLILAQSPPVSMAEAARELGVHSRSLYRMASRGLLETTKVGGRTLVQRSEIERLLRRRGDL